MATIPRKRAKIENDGFVWPDVAPAIGSLIAEEEKGVLVNGKIHGVPEGLTLSTDSPLKAGQTRQGRGNFIISGIAALEKAARIEAKVRRRISAKIA